MTPLFPTRVATLASEADELYDLQLEIAGTPAEGTHMRPGQYVLVAVAPHPPQPFAIASAPGARRFELLVKDGTTVSHALTLLTPGAVVSASAALGKGFPLERARGHNVLLFATGSGISAIRSTLLAIAERRSEFRDVTLFFGARTPSSFAYLDEHTRWSERQIRVVRTVSRPGASGWDGLRGYVQDHLDEHVRGDEVAFLCGQDEMVAAVKTALQRRGLAADNLHLNF